MATEIAIQRSRRNRGRPGKAGPNPSPKRRVGFPAGSVEAAPPETHRSQHEATTLTFPMEAALMKFPMKSTMMALVLLCSFGRPRQCG